MFSMMISGCRSTGEGGKCLVRAREQARSSCIILPSHDQWPHVPVIAPPCLTVSHRFTTANNSFAPANDYVSYKLYRLGYYNHPASCGVAASTKLPYVELGYYWDGWPSSISSRYVTSEQVNPALHPSSQSINQDFNSGWQTATRQRRR